MIGARVLGRFTPTQWTSDTIEQEFKALAYLPACCRKERISVRIPQGLPVMYDNTQWHQDGGGTAGTTRHMVIWASEMPTDLKDAAGDIAELQPLDVVWFDNTICWHRQPAGTNETLRWFVAIRCSGAL